MKKVLFLPVYLYSSIELFEAVANKLSPDCKKILMYFEDPYIYPEEIGLYSDLTKPFCQIAQKSNNCIRIAQTILQSKKISPVRLFKIIYNLKCYRQFIEKELLLLEPDIVITTSDSTFVTKVVNNFSIKKSIPFIIIQPTFIDAKKPLYLRRLKDKLGYIVFNIFFNLPVFNKQYIWGNENPNNILLLWGEYFLPVFKNTHKRNIFICGSPLIDKYEMVRHFRCSEEAKSQLKRNDTRSVITICLQAFHGIIARDDENSLHELYKELIIKNPQYYFYIKVHPRDNMKQFQDFFMESGINNVTITKDQNLLELYKMTDIQISVNSFSSFEAVLCGIPIILVQNHLNSSTDFFNNEIEIRANNQVELLNGIQKCLSSEYYNDFIEKRQRFMTYRVSPLNGLNIEGVIDKFLKSNS